MRPEFDSLLKKYTQQEEDLKKQLTTIQNKIAVLKDLRTELVIEGLSQNLTGLNINTTPIATIGAVPNYGSYALTTADLTPLIPNLAGLSIAGSNCLNNPTYTNNNIPIHKTQ